MLHANYNSSSSNFISFSHSFLLIETSYILLCSLVNNILYDLTLLNYKIILAHPERYTFFQKDYHLIDKILENPNIYLQCNYNSIVGKYGKESKKLMKYLLKNNLVTFLGTDTHKANSSIFTEFEKSKKKIIKLIGEDNFNKLSNTNIEKVLNNEEID